MAPRAWARAMACRTLTKWRRWGITDRTTSTWVDPQPLAFRRIRQRPDDARSLRPVEAQVQAVLVAAAMQRLVVGGRGPQFLVRVQLAHGRKATVGQLGNARNTLVKGVVSVEIQLLAVLVASVPPRKSREQDAAVRLGAPVGDHQGTLRDAAGLVHEGVGRRPVDIVQGRRRTTLPAGDQAGSRGFMSPFPGYLSAGPPPCVSAPSHETQGLQDQRNRQRFDSRWLKIGYREIGAPLAKWCWQRSSRRNRGGTDRRRRCCEAHKRPTANGPVPAAELLAPRPAWV